MSRQNICCFLCLRLNHNISHLSCSLSFGSKGTFPGLLPAPFSPAQIHLQMTKSSPSSPEESVNPLMTLQVVGKDKLDHFHHKLYTGTPLCPYTSLAFASLVRLASTNTVFMHSRNMAVEVLPQMLLLFTPQINPPDYFSNG